MNELRNVFCLTLMLFTSVLLSMCQDARDIPKETPTDGDIEGSDGDTNSDAPNSDIDYDGIYFIAGDWHGDGWTDIGPTAGGTVTELTEGHTFGDGSLCISGDLVADYSSLGMLGMNIRQEKGGEAAFWKADGDYSGVKIDLTVNKTATHRIELNAEDDNAYCAELQSGVNSLSWSNFATECWGTTGTTYTPSLGIKSVQIYAAGNQNAAVSYDYCVEDLAPIASGGDGDADSDSDADADSDSDTDDACSVTTMPSGGTVHSGAYATGGSGNLAYEIWGNNLANSSMTTYNQPAFKASWNNAGDYLARIGYEWGCWNCTPKQYEQYGTISAKFNYTKTGSAGGYSFIGVYGWTTDPCVEWYIVDDSFNGMPFNPGNTTNKGEVQIDGGTYIVYLRHTTGTGGSRCSGVDSWDQYYSIRKTGRQCGTISISEHFKAWEDAGLSMAGNLLEAKILIETGGGVGTADFPIAEVTAANP